ncbi:MAG TPA: condensation domain-containing protein, partial [Gemmatimonadales bacterium]|nr:condensation domain-containing protein [Gemmatimonadales bacterium]
MGRWLADGTIEFLGRNDHQVKLRGYRIELGEIEARLAEHEGVNEAVVVVQEDASEEKRLIAYYTCLEGREIGAEELRSHLHTKLPEYMVPAVYVRLQKLPLTPNGKVDRKGLPAPEGDAYGVRRYAAPVGEMETVLASIWAEALKVDRVGRDDDFFELGGHSLRAMRLISQLRQALGVEVAISDLFAHPVLSDFALVVGSAAQTTEARITPVLRGEPLPLSFAQQRLWFLAQLEGVSRAYHIFYGWRLKGLLNNAALRQALDGMVRRHEALRTRFAVVNGEPRQWIQSAAESAFELVEEDIDEPELERVMAQEASASFDLARGPLLRGRLLRLGEEEHALLLTMHHIVADGWSMDVLMKELRVLYGAYVQGAADPLPELTVQYADYAVWQRQWMEGEVLRKQAQYWERRLAGAPALLELPLDHARPAEQEYAGGWVKLELEEELTRDLNELSKKHGTTLYMTLLAGWSALLARLSGQEEIVVGAPVANRGRREIEGLVGFFVNTLALRLDVSGALTVSELLRGVKEQVLAGQLHQDIPFEQVVEIVGPVRSLSHSPLFQVVFAWESAPEVELALPGLELEKLESTQLLAKFDLTLSLQEAGERIVGGLKYAAALFEQATIERYAEYFRRLLKAVVANPESSIRELPLLSEAERHELIVEWNATEAEYPREKCVHELFEAQVAQTPDAVAVVFEDEALSYGELNRRANQLAHYLRELGVIPGERVALLLERSIELVVAQLAVLKSGAAYVPIDPTFPEARQAMMVRDSGAAVAITTAGRRLSESLAVRW